MRFPLRFIVPVVAALLLAGCLSFGPNYGSLKPGASRKDVLDAMSDCPDYSNKTGRYEALTFYSRMPTLLQWKPENYVFILKDGKLVEFGAGTAVPGMEGSENVLKFSPIADAGADATAAPVQLSSACAAE